MPINPSSMNGFDYTPQRGRTAAEMVIDYVFINLPEWRRTVNNYCAKNENLLTQSLVIFLQRKSRFDNILFNFISQYSDGSRRSVDLAIDAIDRGTGGKIITVIEAKRLPAPSKNRLTEYVYGFNEKDIATGGIQRFKLGEKGHGSGFPVVAILGYVQQECRLLKWQKDINAWIKNCIRSQKLTELE